MFFNRRLVERYVLAAVLPYFLLSLVLFTAIFFVQQLSRLGDLFLRTGLPAALLHRVELALLPGIFVFTLPTAVLFGVLIGFGRMASDSELVAIRAAGVSDWTMVWPVLLLGAVATTVALYLNMTGAPRGADVVRRSAIEAALYKLESPVEPHTLTTDIPGYVVYVRDGDKTQGQWGRVFIYSKEPDQSVRLITARSGRIDSSGEKSELLLNDAVSTKLPPFSPHNEGAYTLERLSQLRLLFNLGRTSFVARLHQAEEKPDEMDWGKLRAFLHNSAGEQRQDAEIVLHRRFTLSLAPLLFALFSAALALRVRRGGRGFGALVSIFSLGTYYLISLAGEQMARAGDVSVALGQWLATVSLAVVSLVLALSRNIRIRSDMKGLLVERVLNRISARVKSARGVRTKAALITFPSLLDVDIIRPMALTFLLAFTTLAGIFDVFTVFDLWRMTAPNPLKSGLVAEYLAYLLPLVSVELFPGSVLIAALMTYALIARRSEAIAWWASGQSVYRLMLPGLLFATAVSAGLWVIQEQVMPQSNIRQDTLRDRIRGNVAQFAGSGTRWLVAAGSTRIYEYEYDARRQILINPTVYDFDDQGVNLRRVIRGREARWLALNTMEVQSAEVVDLGQQLTNEFKDRSELTAVEPKDAFRPGVDQPSQMSAQRLRAYASALKERGADTGALLVALQRKYSDPFKVIVLALIGIPLAISFGRRSAIIALCAAVAVSFAFWMAAAGFEELGMLGLLPAAVAAWAPLLIFGGAGLYFISRVRT
jgi:LPS export ABC transporter permease LptG